MKGKITLAISVTLLILILILMDIRINPFVTFDSSSNFKIDLPESYSEIQAGSEIWFTIKLLSLEELGRRDVTLKYEILDEDEKVIITKSETVAIETQASFVNSLQIPNNLPLGKYQLKALLITESETRETEVSFSVIEKENENKSNIYFISIIPIILILLFLGVKSKSIFEKIRIKSKVKRIVKQRIKSQVSSKLQL